MSPELIARIFFFYGLAFFSMGLAILLERGRASDSRLRQALGMLAFFGLVHGGHEWLEMFLGLGILPWQLSDPLLWQALRLTILAISFFGLAAFGAFLLATNERARKWGLTPALVMALLWGLGLLLLRSQFIDSGQLWEVADVWTRYTLAIPAALLAAGALIAQRQTFRAAGMPQFGRDSLIAALAFAAYGVIGQFFTRPSSLPPSTFINGDLFYELFGFPVQMFRAGAAMLVMVFVIRMMRSFEMERQHQLENMQAERLAGAESRQFLRGELLNRVVQAQESERQRIARELHDETGQALTAIGLGLRGVAGRIENGAADEASQLGHLEDLANHALNELQRLIAGLRPSHLDDLGLAAALRWYAGEVERRAPLSVRVEIEGEERPMPDLHKVGLFRVAQEALTNVVKHASAEEVKVRLSYLPSQVCLEFRDNGVGFDVPGADRPSWGLIGMQERVALLGGEFELTSQVGLGTQITVTVPTEPETGQEYDTAPAVG